MLGDDDAIIWKVLKHWAMASIGSVAPSWQACCSFRTDALVRIASVVLLMIVTPIRDSYDFSSSMMPSALIRCNGPGIMNGIGSRCGVIFKEDYCSWPTTAASIWSHRRSAGPSASASWFAAVVVQSGVMQRTSATSKRLLERIDAHHSAPGRTRPRDDGGDTEPPRNGFTMRGILRASEAAQKSRRNYHQEAATARNAEASASTSAAGQGSRPYYADRRLTAAAAARRRRAASHDVLLQLHRDRNDDVGTALERLPEHEQDHSLVGGRDQRVEPR